MNRAVLNYLIQRGRLLSINSNYSMESCFICFFKDLSLKSALYSLNTKPRTTLTVALLPAYLRREGKGGSGHPRGLPWGPPHFRTAPRGGFEAGNPDFKRPGALRLW